MKYGLIGEKLGHSFSKEIHALLADYTYELTELTPEETDDLMQRKDFSAINVTIPYKERVMPFLDRISENAEKIGSVNTIVNKNGTLYGYNTDILGMKALICRHTESFTGKNVLILGGDGGTARTAYAAAAELGAKNIYRVSRTPREGFIDYQTALQTDANVIINTTPVGMFPKTDAMPIDPAAFKNISLVIDAIYNPLRTPLVLAAQKAGIAAEGGLYMLAAQAVYACRLFTGKEFNNEVFQKIYAKIRAEKENIVLIGMPGCGKTTVGKMLAERLHRPFIDVDAEIVAEGGREISEIFAADGEEEFRRAESRMIKKIAEYARGAVIATGGGAVLRGENTEALKKDGRIYFIDRAAELLLPTADRPLANSVQSIKKRFEERYGIYCESADVHIISDNDAEHTAKQIEEDFLS